jgi:hypothetical protein
VGCKSFLFKEKTDTFLEYHALSNRRVCLPALPLLVRGRIMQIVSRSTTRAPRHTALITLPFFPSTFLLGIWQLYRRKARSRVAGANLLIEMHDTGAVCCYFRILPTTHLLSTPKTTDAAHLSEKERARE